MTPTVLAPRVKVCGITRLEDATLAVELGASAVGFVFWPNSPRAVRLEVARSIARQVTPFVATVGVFVDQPFDEVLAAAATVPLTAVQFHGDEADEAVLAFPWRVIRAVSLETAAARARLARLPHTVSVLLDAHDPVRRGGTGQTTDWTAAAEVSASRPIILAGGLTPVNVGLAVRTVRPWGLDVASGVEAAPGIKDASLLRAFFEAVHEAGRRGAAAGEGGHVA
jgi:phosphoribosylanthranilate isomerase